jgi:hypothetical protein
MKRFATILAPVLVLAVVCSAQEQLSTDQAQSVAAAAKASRAQVKTVETKEANIRQLLELTHAGAVATQTMDAMEGNMRTLMTNAFPPGEYREKLIDLFFAKFHEKRDTQQLVELAVPVYSKYYSDDEIKQLIQLYQTPVGQKLLGVTPKIIAELQGAGQKWGEELGKASMMEVLSEHPEMEKALEQAQKAAKPGNN